MEDRNRAIRGWILALGALLIFCGQQTVHAAGPQVTLAPGFINFPSQLATTSSSPQTVTLTNTGDQALTITAISVTGLFSQTNTCPTTGSLAAGANCTFSITFNAPNGGPVTQPGFVQITDNAVPLGVQAISLSGIVADFSLVGDPTSSTVGAGSSAKYTITATASGGFNQAISFTCGALPTGASCGFSPSSITPGASPATTQLTVTTSAGSIASPISRLIPPTRYTLVIAFATTLFALAALFLPRLRSSRLRMRSIAISLLVLLFGAVGMAGCGGGGGGGGGSSKTPAGTYSVLITGSPTGGPSSLANPLVVTLVVN